MMNQIQLSDTQSVILSAACARDDGLVFPIAANIKGGAVGNVCKSLLTRGLIEEIQACDLNSVWRHDEEQGPITLRATPLAYSTLGIAEDAEEALAHTALDMAEDAEEAPIRTAPRIERGGKQATLIEMLKRPEGATIQQIVDATGWQPHTVRGAIAGALKKKLGLKVVSEKIDGCERTYRIEA